MRKVDFHFLLLGASYASFKFAEGMVSDELSTEFRYNVDLSMSHDSPDLTGFVVYPEDAGKRYTMLTAKEVVDVLCRDEKVPVWVDVSVESVTQGFTVFRLLCAGRFSGNPDTYYYSQGGSGPFGIKSPVLPPDHVEGKKFKLRPVFNPK